MSAVENAVDLAVIGAGPRGLSVLQGIGASAERLPAGTSVLVHLIEPGEPGQGTHAVHQPDYLMTNTVANQLSMFGGESGPSFLQWAQSNGGEPPVVADGARDYLPRHLLGGYLRAVFDYTVRTLPPAVRVVHHRDSAVDLEAAGPGRLVVHLAGGTALPARFAVLATGHCTRAENEEDRAYQAFVAAHRDRNKRLGYLPSPYPIERLDAIDPDATVAVQGLGLTAHDVIAALTVGRGGRFVESAGRLRYEPSGREPSLRLFSRGCVPAGARGANQKGITGQHRARFFTPEAVRALRDRAMRERGDARLDFAAEVLPLLVREMGYAYRMSHEQRQIPAADYVFDDADRDAVAYILDPVGGQRFGDHAEFAKFLTEFLETDLEQAVRGNLSGPLKAAADVIRDTRAALREAVEFGGLTPESHRDFNARYVPLMNRVAFGPPRRRNRELLSLLAAGVAEPAGGPGCRIVADENGARFDVMTEYASGTYSCAADVLVAARLDVFHPQLDSSPLTAAILRRGLMRPFRNGEFLPGGFDVRPDSHPLDASGKPVRNLWVLGYPAEGPRFYTHALPRYRMGSQFGADADGCVRDLLAQIGAGSGDLDVQ